MSVAVIRMLAKGLAALSLPKALAVGRGIGWLAANVLRFRRRTAAQALRRAFPEKSDAERNEILQRMYRNLGMTGVEMLRVSVLGLRDLEGRVSVHMDPELRERDARGEATLHLMGHINNWELCGYLTQITKRKVSVVVKMLRNTRLNDYLISTREKMGLNIMPSRYSYRPCLRTLKEKGCLAIILDQNAARHMGVFVDFFGHPACTSTGLALLSAQTQTPVYPIYSLRRGNLHHDMFLEKAIPPPPDTSRETLSAATQEYTKFLESLIRRHPDQWLWIHKRWRTQPKPGPVGGDTRARAHG